MAGWPLSSKQEGGSFSGRMPTGTKAGVSLMSRSWGAGGSSEPFGHEMLRFQDPGSIFRPLRAERTLKRAHCLEGKTEAQRGMWLAQSHVVVARKGSGLHVCIPDSKAVFGQQGPGPGWETSIPSTLPFLLPIQMPAPGYSHLFSREVGGWPPGGQSSRDGGRGWPRAAQLSGSHPSMWTAVWAAVLATFPEHAPKKTRNVSWMTQSPIQVTHSCGRAVRRGLGCL